MRVGEHEIHKLTSEDAARLAIARIVKAGDFAVMSNGCGALMIVCRVIGIEFLEKVGNGPRAGGVATRVGGVCWDSDGSANRLGELFCEERGSDPVELLFEGKDYDGGVAEGG